MAKNYSYPRVEMNTTTNKHSSVQPAAEDTTTLLAMCIAEKGPVDGLTVVHSLAEFNSIFGTLSYADNGQTALNIYNWLSNGGTAYVKRFPSYEHSGITSFVGSTESGAPVLFVAKYPGAFYEDLKIRAEASYTGATSPVRYTLTLIKDGIVVEKFYRLPIDKLEDAVAGSEFISLGAGFADTTAGFAKLLPVSDNAVNNTKDLRTVAPAAGETAKTLEDYIVEYITDDESDIFADLENKLLAPVEVVLGAGYDAETDAALLHLLEIRDDLVIILDNHKLTGRLNTPISKDYDSSTPEVNDHTAIVDQFFTQYDNVFTGRNIYVTQTYYLSALMPYNDNIYGIQHPIAGLRRGVLSSPTTISENLTPARKDELFKARINYVEKTTREYAIMSQRTHDGSSEDSYTALSFLNNVRTLERMKKEIERIARGYLYEFNDSTTLSQLSNVLNKYITEWISNRTLAKGNVTVAKNAYSDEAIDVGLNIKFNGTVEVIHVDIVVD
jgi:hypothetical protein